MVPVVRVLRAALGARAWCPSGLGPPQPRAVQWTGRVPAHHHHPLASRRVTQAHLLVVAVAVAVALVVVVVIACRALLWALATAPLEAPTPLSLVQALPSPLWRWNAC